MTQNTESETDRRVANLTSSIRKTTGAMRDSQARALLEYVDIDLLSMLVAASERYQVAERALISAEENLTEMINALKKMTRLGPCGENRDAVTVLAAVAVFSAAREYVATLTPGNDQSRLLAKRLFVEATKHITDLTATDDCRAEIPTLACVAMTMAMAEETERVTKNAYQIIQSVVHDQVHDRS